MKKKLVAIRLDERLLVRAKEIALDNCQRLSGYMEMLIKNDIKSKHANEKES